MNACYLCSLSSNLITHAPYNIGSFHFCKYFPKLNYVATQANVLCVTDIIASTTYRSVSACYLVTFHACLLPKACFFIHKMSEVDE